MRDDRPTGRPQAAAVVVDDGERGERLHAAVAARRRRMERDDASRFRHAGPASSGAVLERVVSAGRVCERAIDAVQQYGGVGEIGAVAQLVHLADAAALLTAAAAAALGPDKVAEQIAREDGPALQALERQVADLELWKVEVRRRTSSFVDAPDAQACAWDLVTVNLLGFALLQRLQELHVEPTADGPLILGPAGG